MWLTVPEELKLHARMCMCVCVCTHVQVRAWRGAGILGFDMLFTCFSFKKLSVGLHQAWLFFFMGASVNIFKFQLRLFEGVGYSL